MGTKAQYKHMLNNFLLIHKYTLISCFLSTTHSTISSPLAAGPSIHRYSGTPFVLYCKLIGFDGFKGLAAATIQVDFVCFSWHKLILDNMVGSKSNQLPFIEETTDAIYFYVTLQNELGCRH